MKVCPQCGNQYDDHVKFCGSCGVPLVNMDEPIPRLESESDTDGVAQIEATELNNSDSPIEVSVEEVSTSAIEEQILQEQPLKYSEIAQSAEPVEPINAYQSERPIWQQAPEKTEYQPIQSGWGVPPQGPVDYQMAPTPQGEPNGEDDSKKVKPWMIAVGVIAVCAIVVGILFATKVLCIHKWQDATCTEPQTCSRCGDTQGEPLGHVWEDATCTEPQTCERCGETEGEPLGHDWIDATCVNPKTCERCGETEGDPLGHDWVDATCTEPQTCQRCGAAEGKALGHDWIDATCTEPKTCERCGEIEGEALGHTPGEWTTVTAPTLNASGKEEQVCEVCGEQLDTRTVSKNDPSFDGKTFNFGEEEFIEYLNDTTNSAYEFGDARASSTIGSGTTYSMEKNGELIGTLGFLCTGDKVSAIIIYSDDTVTSAALAMVIAERVDSTVDSDTVGSKLFYSHKYSSSGGTSIMYSETSGDTSVAIVYPTAYESELNDFLESI